MSSMLARVVTTLVLVLAGLSSQAYAEPIVLNIGTFSFGTYVNPDDPFQGTAAFDVANFTGPFALPPDFAVDTPLTFTSLVVTLTDDEGDELAPVALGNLGPGFLSDPAPPTSLQFPDTALFSSAKLDGVLNVGTFLLPDGRLFTADTLIFSTVLAPSVGAVLNPFAFESALITLAGNASDVAPVPEPASMALLASGLTYLYAQRRRTRAQRART